MTTISDAALLRLRAAAFPDVTGDRYAIVEELGRGGMGTVYLAVDTQLGREVALKVPNASDAVLLERRLESEARVLASLEHPGIVPIHDFGRLADGRAFYVMKHVRGRTLSEHMAAVRDPADRLRVFERICEPVAFAHANGCIHRDLKPENVMVGAFGEVMVMDWGVAKRVGGAEVGAGTTAAAPEATTSPGTVVGTRGFMAPEQASGAVDPVDARADVYGLGALLYLLLTDEVPPGEGTAAAAIAARRELPKALRAICARALAADPSGRYQDVKGLADDVARYRAGLAVDAHRESLFDRARRIGRTYRAAILLVAAYVIMRAVVALIF